MGLPREDAAGLAALYRSVGAHPVWEKEAQTQVVFDEASGAFMMDDGTDFNGLVRRHGSFSLLLDGRRPCGATQPDWGK